MWLNKSMIPTCETPKTTVPDDYNQTLLTSGQAVQNQAILKLLGVISFSTLKIRLLKPPEHVG